MGILDWLHGSGGGTPKEEGGLSRRDFFARVAGQGPRPPEPPPPPADEGALYTFHVARFPYHDGPVLVPILRPGLEFRLQPDPHHPTDPAAVRIQWGKDHLGYVPPELGPDVRRRLAEGERLVCRSTRVDPGAELPRVLEVEIRAAPPPEPTAGGDEGAAGANPDPADATPPTAEPEPADPADPPIGDAGSG